MEKEKENSSNLTHPANPISIDELRFNNCAIYLPNISYRNETKQKERGNGEWSIDKFFTRDPSIIGNIPGRKYFFISSIGLGIRSFIHRDIITIRKIDVSRVKPNGAFDLNDGTIPRLTDQSDPTILIGRPNGCRRFQKKRKTKINMIYLSMKRYLSNKERKNTK